MQIHLIVAINNQGGIGYKNSIPWYIPEDLQRFKEFTMGHPVIMGRSTYESLPAPLRGRKNIVVTSRPFTPDNPELVTVVSNYSEALVEAEKTGNDKVFVIGGVSAYTAFWNTADVLHLTKVKIDTLSDAALTPEQLDSLGKSWVLGAATPYQSSKEPYLHFDIAIYFKKQKDLFN